MIAPIRLRTPLIVAVLALALLPGTALGAPGNDDFASAEPVAIDTFTSGSNVDATEAGDEPQPCGGPTVATIWYRISGTGGPVTLNTVGSDPDTVLAVYDTDGTNNGPPADGNAIACNNDIWDGGSAQDDRASELVFPTDAGSDYLVQIGSCAGCGGSLPATGGIEFVAFDPPPNDAPGSAQTLPAGRSVVADNFGATTDAGERVECGAGHAYGKTVWFRFTAPQSGNAAFTTSEGFDAVMAVYRGSTHLGCNDDGVPANVGPSRVALHLAPGEYLIQVGGWGGDIRSAYGFFSVHADFTADPPRDRDGDGIPDASDRCPDENSRARDANRDGCLDPSPQPPQCAASIARHRPGGRTHAPLMAAVTCNKRASVQAAVTLSAPKKKGRKRRPRLRAALGPVTATVEPGHPAALRLALPRPVARNYAGRTVSAALTVTARDADGNQATVRTKRRIKIARRGVPRAVITIDRGIDPSGVSRERGCKGRVRLAITNNRRRLARATVELKRNCRYHKRFEIARSKIGRARQLDLTARFLGNSALGPVTFHFPNSIKVPPS